MLKLKLSIKLSCDHSGDKPIGTKKPQYSVQQLKYQATGYIKLRLVYSEVSNAEHNNPEQKKYEQA